MPPVETTTLKEPIAMKRKCWSKPVALWYSLSPSVRRPLAWAAARGWAARSRQQPLPTPNKTVFSRYFAHLSLLQVTGLRTTAITPCWRVVLLELWWWKGERRGTSACLYPCCWRRNWFSR